MNVQPEEPASPGEPDSMPRRDRGLSMPIRLLVLDVDGTVTNSCHEVTAATVTAIDRVRAAGIRVMLATGRRYRDTLRIAMQLGIDEPLVTASGALVKHPADHATKFRASFAPGVLESVLELVVARGHEPVLYTDSFAEGFDFHCRGLGPAASGTGPGQGFREYLDRNRTHARVTPDLHRTPPPDVFAGFAMGPQGDMLALEAAIHEAWPEAVSLHTIRSPRYRDYLCEVAPAGVTKWSAVLEMARAWDIPPQAICAVGDDRNDVPMVAGAGLGIAMGNAAAEVQAVADRVVGRHDDDGLVDVANLLLATLA
jgi:hydroxymethylpyrimidine pyrophosphatase-like HAD family hydrolase